MDNIHINQHNLIKILKELTSITPKEGLIKQSDAEIKQVNSFPILEFYQYEIDKCSYV